MFVCAVDNGLRAIGTAGHDNNKIIIIIITFTLSHAVLPAFRTYTRRTRIRTMWYNNNNNNIVFSYIMLTSGVPHVCHHRNIHVVSPIKLSSVNYHYYYYTLIWNMNSTHKDHRQWRTTSARPTDKSSRIRMCINVCKCMSVCRVLCLEYPTVPISPRRSVVHFGWSRVISYNAL